MAESKAEVRLIISLAKMPSYSLKDIIREANIDWNSINSVDTRGIRVASNIYNYWHEELQKRKGDISVDDWWVNNGPSVDSSLPNDTLIVNTEALELINNRIGNNPVVITANNIAETSSNNSNIKITIAQTQPTAVPTTLPTPTVAEVPADSQLSYDPQQRKWKVTKKKAKMIYRAVFRKHPANKSES